MKNLQGKIMETNKIYLGDCYELIKQIPNKSIDLIVTDPPYEISVEHGSGAFGIEKKLHYFQFSEFSHGIKQEICKEFVRVLKKINCYIFCNKKQIPMYLNFFINNYKCNFDIISWHKSNPVPACGNKYINDTEYCLFFREKGVLLNGTAETKKTYYLSPSNTKDKDLFEHATIKPIEIIKNLIINSSNENDIVLDPFVGSGTTAVACKELNRQYIGMEISPKWHEVAVKRLQGETANGQLSFIIK